MDFVGGLCGEHRTHLCSFHASTEQQRWVSNLVAYGWSALSYRRTLALLIVYPRVMAYRADAQGMHIWGLLGWFTVARADIVKVTLEDVHLVWRTFATGAPGLFYGHFVEKHLQNVRAYSSINKGEMVVIYTRTRKPVLISPEAAQAFSSTLERLGYPLSH